MSNCKHKGSEEGKYHGDNSRGNSYYKQSSKGKYHRDDIKHFFFVFVFIAEDGEILASIMTDNVRGKLMHSKLWVCHEYSEKILGEIRESELLSLCPMNTAFLSLIAEAIVNHFNTNFIDMPSISNLPTKLNVIKLYFS